MQNDPPADAKPSISIWGLVISFAAVLAILLILFPLFSHPGDCCRSSSLTNVKQVALGCVMYATDFDDHLPIASTWMDSTLPYIQNEQVYVDPDLKDRKPEQHGIAFFEPLSARAYIELDDTKVLPLDFQSALLSRNAASDLSTLPNPPRNESGNAVAFADCHAKRMPKTWPETPIVVVIDPSKKEGTDAN